MICILALVVFGILGIFSATHRKIAWEAFDCVFRRITFRKCTSALDKRLKSQITGLFMRKSPTAARWVYKHFELISWFFVVLLFVSIGYSGYSVYNFVQYGNCNGPEDGGFCPLTALAGETSSNYDSEYDGPLIYPTADDDPSIGPADAKVTIIEFGCYMCPYTREAQPIVAELLETYGDQIRFVFRDFPLPIHEETVLHARGVNCAGDQGKFWEYHNLLFDDQLECKETHDHKEALTHFAEELELDIEEFEACLESDKFLEEVENDVDAGIKAKIYGTPTFFINNRTIVGPKPIKAFKKIIDEELKK